MGYREKEKLLIWMNLTDNTGLFLQDSNLLRYIWYIVTYLYDKLKQLVHL